MGVTALLLLFISKVWQQLGEVDPLPLRLNLQAALIGLGMAIAISLASSLIYRLWPAYRCSAEYYLNLILRPLAWPDLVWLGLLPGLSEELLFRGVMIPAFGSGIIALVVSSVIFGILHASGSQQWPYVAWATITGLALGAAAIYTGNLLVPIIAHIGTNLISSCVWKIQHS